MNAIIDKINQFIFTYYIDPIVYDSGYNIVNTLTWAIILGISIFGIIKLLEKLKIIIDNKFILSLIPFIFAGASFRVVEDAGVIDPPYSYLLITPNIYLLVFIFTVASLVLCKGLESKGLIDNYRKLFISLGIIWFILNIGILLSVATISFPTAIVFVLAVSTILTYILMKASYALGSEILSPKLNIAIIWSHLLDASSTYFGVDFLGYREKHVVPAYLIEITNTALVMFPLKIVSIMLIIYVLDKYINEPEDIELKNVVKLVIIILGLSPAIRNTLRITFGI
ncbi:DUF63 family protein [Methanosalsum natronophilum]|uniref:DUF63 family protein n=1 Tax=Methanosalsum natronophilum TaxID=768733 RepID=A0A424YUL9_9EURY|nr:DUF63 family protein [Methanosalsum natronophilum]MCS3923051.1 putative membrane protein [Methanosalsum natronophilum]RQD82693.1 MAG: DUF63 family protein [Methanosalsum natronophilum]